MLPKTSLGRQMLSRLKVYAGESHPHEAQIKTFSRNTPPKHRTKAVSEVSDETAANSLNIVETENSIETATPSTISEQVEESVE